MRFTDFKKTCKPHATATRVHIANLNHTTLSITSKDKDVPCMCFL